MHCNAINKQLCHEGQVTKQALEWGTWGPQLGERGAVGSGQRWEVDREQLGWAESDSGVSSSGSN